MIEVESFAATESQRLAPHFRGDVRVVLARGPRCLRHGLRLQLRGPRRSLRRPCQSGSRARRRGAPARHGFPPRRRRSAARTLRQERLRRTVSLLGDHSGVDYDDDARGHPESGFTTGAQHFPLVRGASTRIRRSPKRDFAPSQTTRLGLHACGVSWPGVPQPRSARLRLI